MDCKVDYAFLDATFFDRTEVPRRSMEEINPLVVESVKRFDGLSPVEKKDLLYTYESYQPAFEPQKQSLSKAYP